MTAKSSKKSPPQAILQLYDKLIVSVPELERKGATMAYTSLNGHMFSFISNEGEMGLRLPEKERQAFMDKYNTQLCIQYGAVMKEYVQVPASLLQNTIELTPYFKSSYEYIQTLKPKPTKKTKG